MSDRDPTQSHAGQSDAGHSDAGQQRKVDCVKLGQSLPALDKPPFKGELGQRVFENVSREAWRMWIEHSKMLINEFRLDLVSEHGQRVWMAECERYFFGDGSQLPPDYKPQES